MNPLVKERLTGAIILVALIVLLVPELLTGPVRPGSASIAGNSAEEPPLRSYTISLADDARSRAQAETSGPQMPQPGNQEPAPAATPSATGPAGAVSAPLNASPQSTPAAPTSDHSPAAPVPAQKATTHSPKAAHSSAPTSHAGNSGGGWMVQLGVFASRENAEHLAQEMKAKGFRASVSEATGSGRHLYRVRVGPASDRAAAQDLQGRLRAAGRSGTVVPFS